MHNKPLTAIAGGKNRLQQLVAGRCTTLRKNYKRRIEINKIELEYINPQMLEKLEEVKKLTLNKINASDIRIIDVHKNYNSETGAYTVREFWVELDKNSGILKDNGYINNPSAKLLNKFPVINDNLHWPEGTPKAGQMVKEELKYIIDTKGNTVLGEPDPYGKDGLHYFHPTLVGGENPKVITAGQIDIVNGKAVMINNVSGHFKPYSTTRILIEIAFENIPKSEGYFSYQFVD